MVGRRTTTFSIRATEYVQSLTPVLGDSSGASLTPKNQALPANESMKNCLSELSSSLKIKRSKLNPKYQQVRIRPLQLPNRFRESKNQKKNGGSYDRSRRATFFVSSITYTLSVFLRRPHCFDKSRRPLTFRHPSEVQLVRTVDSIHDWENCERQSPSHVRTDCLHHRGDPRADHVVRE